MKAINNPIVECFLEDRQIQERDRKEVIRQAEEEEKEYKIVCASANKRITRGIAWLDKKLGRKKWLKKIDLEKLNIDDTHVCILGQAFGDYFRIVVYGGFNRRDKIELSSVQAAHMGFNTSNESGEILTYLWYMRLKKLGAK